MAIKHALAAGISTLGITAAATAGVAAPADAATTIGTPSGSYGLSCSYDLDKVAGTVEGSCTGRTPLGTATAVFSGQYVGGFAAGTITVDTWFGDFHGSFGGWGWESGTATGAYRMVTPWGALTGKFGATA